MRTLGGWFALAGLAGLLISCVAQQPAPPRTGEAANAAAHKLISEALAAKGGRDRIAALKSIKLVSSGTTTLRGATIPVEQTRLSVFPDKLRLDATLRVPGGPRDVAVTMVIAGQAGWQRGPDSNTVVDLSGSTYDSADFERWRDPELILLRAAAAQRLTTADDDTVDGKPCDVVVLRSPFGEVDVALYIDKETKQLVRMICAEPNHRETLAFSDFRDVHGIEIAYKRVYTTPDQSSSLDIKAIELDAQVDPAMFYKPDVP